MGALDGPGLRTVFFLQGCPLRCLYCHNPDTWDPKSENEKSATELVKMAMKYKPYYRSNGGVTFSGGEPLMQAPALAKALKAIQEEGIHTAIDTCGVTSHKDEDIREVLRYTDLVILDIKHVEEKMYQHITGRSMKSYERFLRLLLESDCKIYLMHVVVPGLTDDITHIKAVKEYARRFPKDRVEAFELLPYHKMGIAKYEELGLDYPLKDTAEMSVEALAQLKVDLGLA